MDGIRDQRGGIKDQKGGIRDQRGGIRDQRGGIRDQRGGIRDQSHDPFGQHQASRPLTGPDIFSMRRVLVLYFQPIGFVRLTMSPSQRSQSLVLTKGFVGSRDKMDSILYSLVSPVIRLLSLPF